MQKPIRLFPLLSLLSLTAFAQSPSPAISPLVGVGVRWAPAYEGSKSQIVNPFPLVRYYGNPWFARTTYGLFEAGARMELAPGLVLGAQLAYEDGRKQSDSDLLRNLDAPDIDPSGSGGFHVEWQTRLGPVPIGVLARVRQQFNTDRGAQADFRLTAGIFARGPIQVALFSEATWANAKSNRTFYGVPGFDPGGGLKSIGFGVGGFYDFCHRWTLIANVEARQLKGDAARSPLVERKSNAYVTTGIAYRF
jgi:outer membrane protein